jgi:hypothetical protein
MPASARHPGLLRHHAFSNLPRLHLWGGKSKTPRLPKWSSRGGARAWVKEEPRNQGPGEPFRGNSAASRAPHTRNPPSTPTLEK